MSRPHRIILLGANGSGKSTLGRALACQFCIAHFDVEDYWFYQTEVPYTSIRPAGERNEMLLADLVKSNACVVSGDVSGWHDAFLSMFDLVVLLTAPLEIRLKRIEAREQTRWGSRVCEGGDMYESTRQFMAFVAARDVGLLEKNATLYGCPILHLDGTNDLETSVRQIRDRLGPDRDMIIRRAVAQDASSLLRLNVAFNGPGNVSEASIAASIRDNTQERVFVAEYDGQLIGFCCVQEFKSFCYDRNYVEITELFVDQAFRRKGVARRLVTYVEQQYFDQKIGGFQLFTGGANSTAQRFYENLGYTKSDEIMYRKRKRPKS